MKNCPHCGEELLRISSTPADDMVKLLKDSFDFDSVGSVQLKRMKTEEIAAVMGMSASPRISTLIGIAAKRIGARSGRMATYRWIEMPPARSDDVFV